MISGQSGGRPTFSHWPMEVNSSSIPAFLQITCQVTIVFA
jgi:hypothetical protein